MLAWATAALLPLLLHLWNRNQHRETPWAAMEFLLAAVQEQARRMRIEQILLLLLRMAIPIVLALALADPIWQWLPSLGSSLSSRPPHHHVFVFDTSYSMGYRVGGRTRLEQSIQLAQSIIDQSPQGDGFTLISMSDPGSAVVASPTFSDDDILAEISGLELRDNEANLPASLALAHQTLERASANQPRLQKSRVYFLSDLGANTWVSANETETKSRIGEIEALAEIVTIDVGEPQPTNTGITGTNRSAQIITPDSSIAWQVNIDDFTGNSAGTREVEMRVDGQLTGKQTVRLEAGQSTSVTFQSQFDSSGQHIVEFHLSDDALAVDNHRYEVVTVRDTVNVLCVEGVPGAARNVAYALAPSANSVVRTRTIPDHRLSQISLESYDCLFLCNLGRFTAERASQLQDYLRHGRGIVMFLGDQVQIENYNSLLASTDVADILPGKLLSLAPPSLYPLAPGNYQHPLVAPFRGQERSGLLTTPVWRYVRLAPFETAKTALEFSNGDPAILERAVLSGLVTVVATAGSELSVSRETDRIAPWTAWSAWPSFVPLIQEMLTRNVVGDDQRLNLLVGESITATLPTTSGARFVTMHHRESAWTQRVAVADGNGPPSWSMNDTYRTGIYATELADISDKTAFAVNLAATRESQLQRTAIDELPQQFQQNSIAAATEADERTMRLASTPLFRLMLGLLLGLLVLESFAAWYFGNARS